MRRPNVQSVASRGESWRRVLKLFSKTHDLALVKQGNLSKPVADGTVFRSRWLYRDQYEILTTVNIHVYYTYHVLYPSFSLKDTHPRSQPHSSIRRRPANLYSVHSRRR